MEKKANARSGRGFERQCGGWMVYGILWYQNYVEIN